MRALGSCRQDFQFAVFKGNHLPNGVTGIDLRPCREKNQVVRQVSEEHYNKVCEANYKQLPNRWNNSWPHNFACLVGQSYCSRSTLADLARKARTRVSYSCRAARCRSTCPALGTNQTCLGFLERSTSMRVSVGLVFLSFSPLMMNTGHSTFAM